MNNEQRKKIEEIQRRLHEHRTQMMEILNTDLQEAVEAEEQVWDSYEEHFPGSEKAETAELKMAALIDWKDEVESAIMEVEEAINAYEEGGV